MTISKADEARSQELEMPTKEKPAVLPKAIHREIVRSNQVEFFANMCRNGSASVVMENVVCNYARKLSDDYDSGYWEFVDLGKHSLTNTFFMYPDKEVYFCVNVDNYAEGYLSGELFGLIVSLFAINTMAFKMQGELREHFVNLFHETKNRVFFKLHLIVERSDCVEEILEARTAQRMIYKFLD